MQRIVMRNGLAVIFQKRPTKTTAVELTVKAGSNYETPGIRGISHFMEHMLFEGTKKRPSSMLISGEIERLGGELNAYTSNERTSFFARVLNKHLDAALDVISDLITNPLFDSAAIEKERKVILKEIQMVTDEPRFHQWVLFQKTLFKRHPCRNATYGTVKTVKKITRSMLLDYYSAYYKPNNMVITIVGGASDIKGGVERYFGTMKPGTIRKLAHVVEPPRKIPVTKREKRDLLNSYVVLGYKTVPRLDPQSYALDIIASVLGRGQSGRLFEEIRNKRGLAYEVGVQHEANIDYGFFAVYLSTDRQNIKKVKSLIFNEFSKLRLLSEKDITEAKGHIEGSYSLEKDDNFKMADELGFWHIAGDEALSHEYIKNIRKTTKQQIIAAARKYLNEDYAMAVIEQK